MTKIDILRRVFLPCFTPTTTSHHHHHHHHHPTTKKRLSTSLRDDIITTTTQEKPSDHPNPNPNQTLTNDVSSSSSSTPSSPTTTNPPPLPPRSSKTMVTGTIFGHRRGPHVFFAVQHHRLNTKPYLLLQLSIPTQSLLHEMRFGLVRLALESHNSNNNSDELRSTPLRSIPIWTMFCNGRNLGFAVRKKATGPIRSMLRSVQSTTVGAGVIPSFGFDEKEEEVIYMRASYECVVGGPDSESFHLINPDGCLGQELSIFLMRSR